MMTWRSGKKGRKAKLTKRAVDAAKPPGAFHRLGHRDAGLWPSGGAVRCKTFIARYRAGGGRAGTLGKRPSADMAR